jgi:hypothetical protein
MESSLQESDIHANSALSEALYAQVPAAAHVAELMTFGQFVGRWDLAITSYLDDGRTSTMSGEVHFGWILDGAAVQDVWIAPNRGESAPAGVAGFHGTTIRFWDPGLDGWRSIWIDPMNARVRQFIGRREGADIVLLSTNDDPWLQWSFTDVAPSTFRWLGQRSDDRGETWRLEEEMVATRSTGA